MLFRVTTACPLGLILDFTHNTFLTMVLRVVPGMSSHRIAVIRPGDCIISVNGKYCPSRADFVGTVELFIWRRHTAPRVTLGARRAPVL